MTIVGTEDAMQQIQLRDAKATLSAVIDQARQGHATVITRHGRPEAVVLSFEEWQRLSEVPSFGRLLMAAPLEAEDPYAMLGCATPGCDGCTSLTPTSFQLDHPPIPLPTRR